MANMLIAPSFAPGGEMLLRASVAQSEPSIYTIDVTDVFPVDSNSIFNGQGWAVSDEPVYMREPALPYLVTDPTVTMSYKAPHTSLADVAAAGLLSNDINDYMQAPVGVEGSFRWDLERIYSDDTVVQWQATITVEAPVVVAPTVTINDYTGTDSTPELSGTVENADEVSVEIDGATYTAIVDGTNWTAQVTTPLADDSYTATVTATNDAGSSTDTATVLIDTTAPTVVINEQTFEDSTPVITGTISGAASATLSINGQSYTATIDGENWFAQVTTALADDVYTATITAVDALGNESAASGQITIDAVPAAPVVTINAYSGTDTTPLLTGTVTGTVDTITLSINGQSYTPVVVGTSWSAQISTLAVGSYTATITAENAGGSDEVTAEVVVEVVPLSVTLRAIRNFSLSGSISYAEASIVVTVTAEETSYEYAGVNHGTAWVATIGDALAEGDWTVTVTASLDDETDAASRILRINASGGVAVGGGVAFVGTARERVSISSGVSAPGVSTL